MITLDRLNTTFLLIGMGCSSHASSRKRIGTDLRKIGCFLVTLCCLWCLACEGVGVTSCMNEAHIGGQVTRSRPRISRMGFYFGGLGSLYKVKTTWQVEAESQRFRSEPKWALFMNAHECTNARNLTAQVSQDKIHRPTRYTTSAILDHLPPGLLSDTSGGGQTAWQSGKFGYFCTLFAFIPVH